jgi:hypothetical protein
MNRVSLRLCASLRSRCLHASWVSATVTAARFASAVNVEDFTLNREVVDLDMSANAKWLEFAERLDRHRAANQPEEVRVAIHDAFKLLEELGEDRAPVQSRVRLLMELSQVEMNCGELKLAVAHCNEAVAQLQGATGPQRNPTLLAEARELLGFILLREGTESALQAAEQHFRELLEWIERGSSREAPMVRVAAKKIRRTVLTGLGETLVAKSRTAGDRRPVCKEALNHLVPALSQHVDESDFASGKRTLFAALECFQSLGDVTQAASTCGRIEKWCARFDDAEGVAAAKAILESLSTGAAEDSKAKGTE